MPYVELADRTIFYTKRGSSNSSKNTILLVHGAGGTHLDWPVQLRRMKDAVVLCLDLPGHGRSDLPGRSEISAYAEDLLGFVDCLDLASVILIGHSMGGAIVQQFTLDNPSNIKGLVLLATGAKLRVSSAILDRIQSNYEEVVEFVTKYAWSRIASPEIVAHGRRQLLQAAPEIVHGDYIACNNFDITDRLNEVNVPTLVLCGTNDKMTPIAYSHYLARNITSAEIKSVSGAVHMLAQERPRLISKAIRDFMGNLDDS